MCKKLLLRNMLTAQRALRPKAAHCRIGEKSKENQSTDQAAMCGLLSGPLKLTHPGHPQVTTTVVLDSMFKETT
jgi:hypothetical protein